MVLESYHHEEGVDDEGDELMYVDVILWFGGGDGNPVWERLEDVIREAPLEREVKALASHGDVTSVRLAEEMGRSWDKKAYWTLPCGGGRIR